MVFATTDFNDNFFGKGEVLDHHWRVNALFKDHIAVCGFLNLIRKWLIFSSFSFETNAHLSLWLPSAELAIGVAAPGIHLLATLGQDNGVVAAALHPLNSYLFQDVDQTWRPHTLFALRKISQLLLEISILIPEGALEQGIWLAAFWLVDS